MELADLLAQLKSVPPQYQPLALAVVLTVWGLYLFGSRRARPAAPTPAQPAVAPAPPLTVTPATPAPSPPGAVEQSAFAAFMEMTGELQDLRREQALGLQAVRHDIERVLDRLPPR